MRSLLLSFFLVPVVLFAQNIDGRSVGDSGLFNSFDHTKIYYETNGTGFPVILLHGFMGDGESWKGTILYHDLLNAGFMVVTPDLRGNGRSDKPREERAYSNDAEAKDIMALTKFLHLKKYYVVGYSRGSIITARLLVLDKKVRKAVIGGMGTGFTNPAWPRRIMFYNAFMGNPVKELEGTVRYAKEHDLDMLVLAYQQKYQPYTPLSALALIRQKVLVVCGDKDSDNGSAAELAKMFKNASLALVPGDHNGARKTQEFSQIVVSFLK